MTFFFVVALIAEKMARQIILFINLEAANLVFVVSGIGSAWETFLLHFLRV